MSSQYFYALAAAVTLTSVAAFSCGDDKANKKKDEPAPTAEGGDAADDGAEDSGKTASETSTATATGVAETWSCPETFKPKGDRQLGLDVINLAETGTFDEGLAKAKELRIGYIDYHVAWSSIETSPGQFTDPGDALASFAAVVDANDLKLTLTVRPIDLTGKTVPTDLAAERFNSALMKSRFKALLNFVLTKVPSSRLVSLQIGNEIDGYDTSAEHEEFWSDYGDFLFEMTTYLHGKDPQLKVGFTGTLTGLTKGPLRDAGVFKSLADTVDLVGVTYYPLQADFLPKSPDVVKDDLAAVVKEFGDKPLFLQEVGYQTQAAVKDSELDQAKFYCNVFQAWDAFPSIKVAEIVRLQDLSHADAVDAAGPYGINSAAFVEYLQRLGIRTYEGKGAAKQAFDVIKKQATLRGF